jgi:adenylate kinase
MGLPGCGKGKQAELLSGRTGFAIVSTGGELRKLAEEKTLLGEKVAKIMNSGELMPSWFVSYIFERTLFEIKETEGVIFEGVGRKEPEARLFDEICKWLDRDYRVVHLNVSEETAIKRLSGRQESGGRNDDNPAIYQNRLKNFRENTLPAIEYFRSVGKVIDISGEPSPELIGNEVWAKVSVL